MSEEITLAEARRRYPAMWVIYDHPKDHPKWFVIRVWYGEYSSSYCYLRSTLDLARRTVEMEGASVNLGRNESDDPAILEVWL